MGLRYVLANKQPSPTPAAGPRRSGEYVLVSESKKSLALDDTHADAHFNLARLSEIRGDKQGLVRHLNAYRRFGA